MSLYVTAIPLREKKQKSLPRSDGCGLNNFDGMFIHCLLHENPQNTWTNIYLNATLSWGMGNPVTYLLFDCENNVYSCFQIRKLPFSSVNSLTFVVLVFVF